MLKAIIGTVKVGDWVSRLASSLLAFQSKRQFDLVFVMVPFNHPFEHSLLILQLFSETVVRALHMLSI
jgi:hypothetical protein